MKVSMPDEYIDKPDKVHQAIQAKKELEKILAPEPITETTPESNETPTVASEVIT